MEFYEGAEPNLSETIRNARSSLVEASADEEECARQRAGRA